MSVVTVYGVCAVTFMMVMYALEHRGRRFIVGFAVGCLLSSLYGFLSGAWPFGASSPHATRRNRRDDDRLSARIRGHATPCERPGQRGDLVRLEGFEPPTLGSVDRCSNPLSYSRSNTGHPS